MMTKSNFLSLWSNLVLFHFGMANDELHFEMTDAAYNFPVWSIADTTTSSITTNI